MKFVRYGSLVPQYHKIPEDEELRSFHTAPVEYGFYAFPRGFEETFLLGGVGYGSLQNGRRRKLYDANKKPFIGHIFDFKEEVKETEYCYLHWEWKSEWKDWFKKHKIKLKDVSLEEKHTHNSEDKTDNTDIKDCLFYLVVENPPKVFDYNGNIWSHIDSYYMGKHKHEKEKAIIKPKDILARSGSWVLTSIKTYQNALKTYISWIRYDLSSQSNKYSNRGNFPLSSFSKDEFEVFIESIQTKNDKYNK